MKTAVIGGGSWGTALASVLANKGPVRQWARDPAVVAGINRDNRNPKYQSDIALDSTISATESLSEAVQGAELVCVVVPSHAMRSVMAGLADAIPPGVPIVSASKGIENQSLETMEEVLTAVMPRANRADLAFLSGPSFARETLLKMATAVTVAARFHDVLHQT